MSMIRTAEAQTHREAVFTFLEDHYDKVTICPYCGCQPSSEALGCCGESSAHFETAYVDEGGEMIDVEDFIESFDLVRELIRANQIMDDHLSHRGLMNLRLA